MNMSERRRALGRGLGALIPQGASSGPQGTARPVDVFFPENVSERDVSRETPEESEMVEVPGAEFSHILVEDIAPNRAQPRTVFDEDDLAELTASVREVGILLPVFVRQMSDPQDGDAPYELVIGERR